MSHPPTMPPRPFSPQHSANPTYPLPPNKRARLSPGPASNPGSPFPNYAPSPRASTPVLTPTGPPTATPNLPNNQVSSGTYNTPYQQANGRPSSGAMSLTMPTAVPTPTIPSPQPQTPIAPPTPQALFSNARFAAPSTATSTPPPAPSAPPVITNMGPPAINTSGSFPSSYDATKQTSKSTSGRANISYDMNDMLQGTGIDLEEEEEYLNNIDTRGFPHYPPGTRDTMYGAGPANQPAQPTRALTQEELAAEAADRAWNEAAAKLARARHSESSHQFLDYTALHKRLEVTAQKFGLGLNLEMKHEIASGRHTTTRAVPPSEFPKPELQVVVQKGPDGAMVQTIGSFVPSDAVLIDQLALISISTKQRLRELIGDANKIATTRQTSAHGLVPPEWLDVAATQPAITNGTQDEASGTGAESAVSPRTNPLKRPADEISNGLPTPVSEASPANPLVDAMTSAGKQARNLEESRLRKRLKRAEKTADKDKEGGDSTSRAGSVAPGTSGTAGQEPGDVRPPTKKESKKAAKLAEASSTTVNQTLGLFAGGKKKKYSWMTAGGPGSGASTPRPQVTSTSGTLASTGSASSRAARGPLTKAGVTHLGQFREDSDKGKNIQLRDWIVALEEGGFDQKTLQEAYDILDKSSKATVESTT